MDEPRPTHDERVVALEDERAAFERAFQYIQNHTHRFVPSVSSGYYRAFPLRPLGFESIRFVPMRMRPRTPSVERSELS